MPSVSTMTHSSRALLFVWRYGVLGVDSYESVASALSVAESLSDYGNGAPHGILHNGEWITPDSETWVSYRRERHAQQDAADAAGPPSTHILDVQAPDGEWAQEDGYPSLGEAVAAAALFDAPSRVRTAGPGSRTVWKSEVRQGDTR